MNIIQAYIEKLITLYGDEIVYENSHYDEKTLQQIPEVLRPLYREVSKLSMPFGEIDCLETALKNSKAEPFLSEQWFCFGSDDYFSFWLCRYTPDEDGFSITYWDHDSGSEIDDAIYMNIIDFLEDMRNEYEEDKNE